VSTEAPYFLSAVAVGLGATLFMDLWALFLKRVFGIASADYCLVGRWFRHMPEGTLVALVSGGWLAHPTLLPALLFGVGTVLVPFLLMQPSFGLGIAASRAPNPTQARLRSLMAHTAFGVGLYVCAVGVSYVLPVHA